MQNMCLSSIKVGKHCKRPLLFSSNYTELIKLAGGLLLSGSKCFMFEIYVFVLLGGGGGGGHNLISDQI